MYAFVTIKISFLIQQCDVWDLSPLESDSLFGIRLSVVCGLFSSQCSTTGVTKAMMCILSYNTPYKGVEVFKYNVQFFSIAQCYSSFF